MNRETKNENLKLKIEKIENKQLKLQKELHTLDDEVKQLKTELLKTLPRANKYFDYIQRLRKKLGPIFIGLIVFYVAILAAICALVIQPKLGLSILLIGSIILLITIIMKEKRLIPLATFLIVALIILLVSSTCLVQSEEIKREHTTFALAIIALGLALQTFYSDGYVEKKLNDIEDKVSKLGNNALTKAESEEKNKGTGGNR